MTQKGASPIVPILLIAIIAVGGYLYMKKDAGQDEKKPESTQGIAVGEPTPQPVPPPSGNPDDVVAAILVSAGEEAAASDASGDAEFVESDTEAINSYADAYDTTDF
jgi:hypothetical protein